MFNDFLQNASVLGLTAMLLISIGSREAEAGIIFSVLLPNGEGQVLLQSAETDLFGPTNAVAADGFLYYSGFISENRQVGAVQRVELATGQRFAPMMAESLNGAGGVSGIFEISVQRDGTPLYVGQSALGVNPSEATIWHGDLSNPMQVAFGTGASTARGASSGGTYVGNVGGAAVGMIGSNFQFLPGGASELAVDITADGDFIVGDTGSIWRLGENGYQQISTLGFETNNGEIARTGGWSGTHIDPVTGKAVFAGGFTNLQNFTPGTGFWNEDGELLGLFENGDFSDFEVWEGELFAGLNAGDLGSLVAISDFSTLNIEELTGSRARLANDGLFRGSAGFLLENPDGSVSYTSYATSPAAVPEPSSFILVLLSGLVGLLAKFKRKLLTLFRWNSLRRCFRF